MNNIISNSKFKDIVQEEVKMPSGTFFCKSSGKNATEHKFNSCDEAIDWYINTYIAKDQRASVHRENIMKHIMKSIRTKKKYAGYNGVESSLIIKERKKWYVLWIYYNSKECSSSSKCR